MKATNKHNIQFLSDIPRKNNFELPKDYFKTAGDALFSQLYLQEIHTTDPKRFDVPEGYFNEVDSLVLTKLKTQARYKNHTTPNDIPTDYFETLEDRIMEKLPKQSGIIQFKTLLKSKLTPIAIAASLLLIFTLGNINKANAVTFENISSNDIEAWVENGYLIFNTEDFTSQVTDTALELDNFSNIYTHEQALDFLQETDLENILFEE